MRIADLSYENSGVEIQGLVKVQEWNDELNDNIELFKSRYDDPLVAFPKEIMEKEISYMFTTMESYSLHNYPMLVIEVQ